MLDDNNQQNQQCGNCKYYLIEKMKVTEGRCRRYPPAVNLLIGQQGVMIKADYPPVAYTEWCGEYLQKIVA